VEASRNGIVAARHAVWHGRAMCVRPRTQASLAVTALHRRGHVGELVDDFVKRYAAPREKILADALLRGLADKKLLEL
jgi:hypothetical protein